MRVRSVYVSLLLSFIFFTSSCVLQKQSGDSRPSGNVISFGQPSDEQLIPNYGDDLKIFYHWGDANFLNRLTDTHIPNHIYPGEEQEYGYYSDSLYDEVMKHSENRPNKNGAGLYVAVDPVTSIYYAQSERPKLIEVIIDSRIADNEPRHKFKIADLNAEWYVVKTNKGVYFREFSGAGFSIDQLQKVKQDAAAYRRVNANILRYLNARIDGIIKNPQKTPIRVLPPRDWVCAK